MKIHETALLLIDLQKEDSFLLENFDRVVGNAALLLSHARSLDIPVFYTRHVNDALGRNLARGEPVDDQGRPTTYRSGTTSVEIIDSLAPEYDDDVIDKRRYSAFHGTRLAQTLSFRGIKHLVVAGVMTDVCVMSSLFDAYQNDFRVSLVADACTATTSAAHYSALLILSNWLYELEIFNTKQILRRWRNLPSVSLRTAEPDHLAFQPEAFEQVIASFESRLAKAL